MRTVLAVATGIALLPLVLIVYFLLQKGLGSWNGKFFTSDPNLNQCFPRLPGAPPPPPCDIGGIRSAILGTIEIVALATLVAVPVGWRPLPDRVASTLGSRVTCGTSSTS